MERGSTGGEKTREAVRPCSGASRSVNGRPCLHELIKMVDSRGSIMLTPAHFHTHWFIRQHTSHQESPRILEPATIVKKRKKPKTADSKAHRRKHGRFGTAREPTFSEMADLTNSSATFGSTAPTVLPPLSSIVQYEEDTVARGGTESTAVLPFYQDIIPLRTWGYAGHRPL